MLYFLTGISGTLLNTLLVVTLRKVGGTGFGVRVSLSLDPGCYLDEFVYFS
jgi:hypothetical protein